MVCKLVISKIGGTYSIFHKLISTIVVKENIIWLAKEDNSSVAFKWHHNRLPEQEVGYLV